MEKGAGVGGLIGCDGSRVGEWIRGIGGAGCQHVACAPGRFVLSPLWASRWRWRWVIMLGPAIAAGWNASRADAAAPAAPRRMERAMMLEAMLA